MKRRMGFELALAGIRPYDSFKQQQPPKGTFLCKHVILGLAHPEIHHRIVRAAATQGNGWTWFALNSLIERTGLIVLLQCFCGTYSGESRCLYLGQSL